MGDIIEFSTLPLFRRMFYKISNNAITFDVKTSGAAIVGLAKTLCNRCDLMIFIGVNNKTLMKDINGTAVQANTPNIVNGEQFTKFWCMQDKDHVSFGRQGETDPILKFPLKDSELNYITFFCAHQLQKVYWKIELPPLFNMPHLKPITKGRLRWETMGKQLPEDALIGGYENEPLYIVRKLVQNSLVLGKYVPSERVAYISWGGRIYREKEFEVLCGYDCKWVPTKDDKIPVQAYKAGYSDDDKEFVYIARAQHCGYIIPGRLQASQKACHILKSYQQVVVKNYEILTLTHGLLTLNKFLIPNEDARQNVQNNPDVDYNLWGPLNTDDNTYAEITEYF